MKINSQSTIINAGKYFKIESILSAFDIPKNSSLIIEPSEDKNNINVEVIRDLKMQTRTKRTKNSLYVLISNASKMTIQAQNAFLKLLEEPNENTFFILVVENLDNLLETTLSRCQILNYKEKGGDIDIPDDIKNKVLFMANGNNRLVEKMIADNKFFDKENKIFEDAKKFVFGDKFNQTCIITDYVKDRELALEFISASLILARFMLNKTIEQKFIDKIEKLIKAEDSISKNCNTRMQLLKCID